MGVNLYELGRMSLEQKFKAGKGRSKHEDKGNNGNLVPYDYIYTYQTLKKYIWHYRKFCSYLLSRGIKAQTFFEMVIHLQEYIDYMCGLGYSAWTQKLAVSAIRKATDVYTPVNTHAARRQDIKRSRKHANDEYILEKYVQYPDVVRLCLCAGPRKDKELAKLRGTDLRKLNGKLYVFIQQGKNGQERFAPLVGSAAEIRAVVKLFKAAGNGLVFQSVPSDLDVHALRAIYACRVYLTCARPIDAITNRKDKYYFRRDMRGLIADKTAMRKASEALGHHRVSVIGAHYMWALEYVKSTNFRLLLKAADMG